MSEPSRIPLAGKFDCWHQSFDFPDLLLAVCRTGKTGHLLFSSGEAEKTVIIQDGQVIFAKSSSTDDRLGPYLMRARKIRFEHLIELSRFISPAKRFGTVLVESGVLTPKDLVQGVIGQVRSIVLSLFGWSEAAYAFEERSLEKETITLRIPTAKLIADGVRQVTSWRRVTTGLGSLDAVYRTNDDVEERAEKAGLDPDARRLLAELRGPKTIAEACAESELSDFEVCQLLWAFRSLEWVGPVTEVHPVVMAEVAEPETDEPNGLDETDGDGLGMVLRGGS
ncbi:MAG TPA: DUF4388 domain-containing protein [Vicinamibacteria bacterium]|nr:DUF4388 domain-containing protein [Vicinamibacteria bacterium]